MLASAEGAWLPKHSDNDLNKKEAMAKYKLMLHMPMMQYLQNVNYHTGAIIKINIVKKKPPTMYSE